MFRRLLFENWVCVFPVIAFITAGSIYATIFYRAIRMKTSQIEHFSQLPFEPESTVSSNESK